MVGYLRGPRLGSLLYDLISNGGELLWLVPLIIPQLGFHNWAIGLAFLGAGFWFGATPRSWSAPSSLPMLEWTASPAAA